MNTALNGGIHQALFCHPAQAGCVGHEQFWICRTEQWDFIRIPGKRGFNLCEIDARSIQGKGRCVFSLRSPRELDRLAIGKRLRRPRLTDDPKSPGPRIKATIFPSGEMTGICAESLKLVSCSQIRTRGPVAASRRSRSDDSRNVAARIVARAAVMREP